MPDWDGMERREVRTVCSLHGNMDRKLDEIIQRQEQAVLTVTHIKAVVEDGLKSTVENLNSNVLKLVDRVAVIEDFSWFRVWVTDLRDNLFKNVLKIAALGGGIYALVHFGDKLIKVVTG